MIHNRPPLGATLDRSHALSRGLVVALPLNEPGVSHFRNLADGQNWLADSAAFWSRDRIGMRGTGAASQSQIAGASQDIGSEYTIELCLMRTANADVELIKSANDRVWIDWNGGLSTDDYWGAGFGPAPLNTIRNRWQQLVERGGAWGADLWQDGQRIATTVTAPGAVGTVQGLGVQIGTGALFNDILGWVRVWNRALSDAELQSIQEGRWPNLTTTKAVFFSDLLPSLTASAGQPASSRVSVFQLGTLPVIASGAAPAAASAVIELAVPFVAAGAASGATKASVVASISLSANGVAPAQAKGAAIAAGVTVAIGRGRANAKVTATNVANATPKGLAPASGRVGVVGSSSPVVARGSHLTHAIGALTNRPPVAAQGAAPSDSVAGASVRTGLAAAAITPSSGSARASNAPSIAVAGHGRSHAASALAGPVIAVVDGRAASGSRVALIANAAIVARGGAPSASRSDPDSSFIPAFGWPRALASNTPLWCFALPTSAT